jgi:hypothetical protein
MMLTGSTAIDAERAFARATRARRRASLMRILRRRPSCATVLSVFDEMDIARTRTRVPQGLREIPIEAITGTLEPARAPLFDKRFRPARRTRTRWERLWMAEHQGIPLPPISVVQVGREYLVRDGHHRVSVALARGATTIDAVVVP